MVEAAFILAAARRTFRPPNASPLDPIRSLHYFLGPIEELMQGRVDPSYLEHLRHKLQSRAAPSAPYPHKP